MKKNKIPDSWKFEIPNFQISSSSFKGPAANAAKPLRSFPWHLCFCWKKQHIPQKHKFGDDLHPWKLPWNPKMQVWKMIFLFKQVIFRFHVNFPGCIMVERMNRWSFRIFFTNPIGYIPKHLCLRSRLECISFVFLPTTLIWLPWKAKCPIFKAIVAGFRGEVDGN